MKPRTVVSLEQALSLPSATLRFVQLGWRVIRVEATPRASGLPGDPNRYIGARVVDDDRRSYFLAPNVGKQSIALNLKDEAGRAALHRIIRELDADIFCCNTLPGRYQGLGIDYATLCQHKPDIIWAGISAMGPEYPDIPGYDPAIQAMSGFMEVTGREDGPPTLSGIPLIDLKAGDEVYAGVCLALAERAETGKGKEIHVSMLQAAASWLITTLPLLDFNPDYSEVTRCGNEHRKFIPTNAYPTSDGHIYIAIGNDIQWRRFTDLPKFNSVASDARVTNEGRLADRYALYKDIGEITARYTQAELAEDFKAAGIAHAPILDVPKVRQLPAVSSKLTTTRTPDGKTVHMQPPAVDIEGGATDFAFPAKYGQDTGSVLRECGLSDGDIRALAEGGSIYQQPGQ